jgi:O-succinylbenzoic acid--CoA ligase
MEVFADAAGSGSQVVLADPAWGPAERAELARLTDDAGPIAAGRSEAGWLMIPSGGTGGKLKFARHDGATISAAVRGFAEGFGVEGINQVGVLPMQHVSGFMAWMRAGLTGGAFMPWDWKRLEAGERPILPGGPWFISLVPTQLQRLIASPGAAEWLRGFRAILVGGGPVWPSLCAAAADARLPVSLTYGTTETAAMVTALAPGDFLSGIRTSGAPLPHARIGLTSDGVVWVGGNSLFRGHVPAAGPGEQKPGWEFVTGDLGRIDERGHLVVLGRKDSVIITGGEKVDPQEVEAALWASGEYFDVAVVGMPDPEWGEAVVACYPADRRPPDLSRASARGGDLAAFKRPRRFLAVPDWPRNSQGKVNRTALLASIRIDGH